MGMDCSSSKSPQATCAGPGVTCLQIEELELFERAQLEREGGDEIVRDPELAERAQLADGARQLVQRIRRELEPLQPRQGAEGRRHVPANVGREAE